MYCFITLKESSWLYTPISTRSGFEDDDIIDGGWFDDVIITPDNPDPEPEPEWPDWPEPEWPDAYYPGGIGRYGKDAQGNKLPGYVDVEFEAKVFTDLIQKTMIKNKLLLFDDYET